MVLSYLSGPYGANLFDPQTWGGGDGGTTGKITLEVTRVVHAIGVFAIGVELPKAYLKTHWTSLAFLLGPVMISVISAFVFCVVSLPIDRVLSERVGLFRHP